MRIYAERNGIKSYSLLSKDCLKSSLKLFLKETKIEREYIKHYFFKKIIHESICI